MSRFHVIVVPLRALGCVLLATAVLACGSGDFGTHAVLDLESARDGGHFFDFPFPSDLRVTETGAPDMTGYPNPTQGDLFGNLITAAGDRRGFPVMSTSYFRFDGPLPVQAVGEVQDPDAPFVLVDIDPDSPSRGTRYPVVVETLDVEAEWSPGYVVAVAPAPGIILRPDTTYGVAILRSIGDASGHTLARSDDLIALARGDGPARVGGDDAAALYEPLWPVLGDLDVQPTDVAAATVFTTGDVVADLAQLSDAVLENTSVSIDGLEVDPDDGADHARYCELLATVSMPQYQVGTPPFNEGGLFELGEDGTPVVQRYEDTQVVLTLPTGTMPAGGYPLMMWFHGSGGVAAQVVDRGHSDGTTQVVGEGPAYVVAEHGIGAVAASLPLSPDRLPGAGEIEYINFHNLAAFRDTFRQGVIESRLLLAAVLALQIDPSVVSACELGLPAGESAYHYDPTKVVMSGQSMGGMYTNLVAAVEPLARAVVPTGAGGHWNRMIVTTQAISGARDLVALLVRTDPATLSFVHPGLNLLSLAWEPAEPFVYMPRLAERPLPGHPSRSIYEPVGTEDEYFSENIYDAAALAYGNQQAGMLVWGSMQDSLALAGEDGMAEYAVSANRTSESGDPYTGVVVQYENDGILSGHYIFAQLDEVKYQYGCFLATFLGDGAAGGVGVVPAPMPLGTPCPE